MNLNNRDSIKISNFIYTDLLDPFSISPDKNHIYCRNTIYGVRDSVINKIIDFIGPYPMETDICGANYVTFHPKKSEIIFSISCDGTKLNGDEYVIDRIGTFNYKTLEFTNLNKITGIESGTSPVYSHDGTKIAFLDIDNNKAYIIYREGE